MAVNPFVRSEDLKKDTSINPFPKKEIIKNKEPLAEKLEEEIKEEPEHVKILKEHGGLESNIPIHHQYWRIRP